MYTTSYLCPSDLNWFMTYWTIQKLELNDKPVHFYINNIEKYGNIMLDSLFRQFKWYLSQIYTIIQLKKQVWLSKYNY